MNPCPQCGAIPQTSDKFCNVCGNVLMQQGGGYPGAPPPQYGGQPQPGFGAPPGYPPQPGGYPMEQQNYGAPPPDAYGQPQYPPQPGYGQPQGGYPAQQGYGGYPDPNAQPAPGFGPNYGGPQYPAQPQGGFPPAGGYDAQQGGGYPAPPAAGGYDAQQGGGYPPPQSPQGQPSFPPPLPAGGGVAPIPAAAAPEGPLPPQALRAFIVSYQANTTGDFWPLHGGRKTVGRANSGEGVDIPISDATVSSKHAAFNIDGTSGAVVVEDTGSTNGTYVNDEHIGFNGRRDLRDGDRVRFGGFTTIVKLVGR